MGLVQLLPVRLGVRNLCIPVKAITYDKEVMTWCESGVVWLRGQTMNIRHERQTNLLAPPPAFGRLGAANERLPSACRSLLSSEVRRVHHFPLAAPWLAV